MVNIEKIRVTDQSGLSAIPGTTADMLVVVDRATDAPSATLPFPTSPVDGQIFMITSRIEVTALTLDTGAIPISGGVTSILAGEIMGWIYDQVSNRWFSYFPNGKLNRNGNGSQLTGLTASQVGLGNVNNTADSAKPVSTAQQTALDLKANVASPAFTGTPTGIGIPVYARVTGSNATTTGQVLVNVTGLENTLVANAVYEFEAVMSCSTSAVTTGISYGVNFSAAGATIEAHITGASSTTATKAERISAFNAASTAFLATSGQAGGVRIKGIVVTGVNAGNLSIRHLKITSGTSTVFINSFLKVTRIS